MPRHSLTSHPELPAYLRLTQTLRLQTFDDRQRKLMLRHNPNLTVSNLWGKETKPFPKRTKPLQAKPFQNESSLSPP
jgi:hypothetical protein